MSRKNIIKCSPEILSKDLSGKVYIVTGANSGVGLETTRQLIKQGGHVVMACRRVDAGLNISKEFSSLKGSFEVMKLDLADLQSVRDFVTNFLKKHQRLDALDCNAGLVVMGNEAKYTKDGFEETIGVNFLGHFLLTERLLDILIKTENSRIIILSSVVHAGSPKKRYTLNFDDLNYKKRKYNAFDAYGEAKVASVLYAKELAERLKDTSVTTASIHPGWARSNFGGNGFLMNIVRIFMKPFNPFLTDSNEDSAQTSLYCLISDEARNHSGAYFSQSSVLYRDKECKNGGWPLETPNPHARDMDMAKKLTALSYKLVKLES